MYKNPVHQTRLGILRPQGSYSAPARLQTCLPTKEHIPDFCSYNGLTLKSLDKGT